MGCNTRKRERNDSPKWEANQTKNSSFRTLPSALAEDLVVRGNSGAIPRYYSLSLRWCSDVRGTREGDKRAPVSRIVDEASSTTVSGKLSLYNIELLLLGSTYFMIFIAFDIVLLFPNNQPPCELSDLRLGVSADNGTLRCYN